MGGRRIFMILAEVLRRFESEAVRGVCDTARYRCRYYVWGQGPPLVFVHGFGDVAQAYVPVIGCLASRFRCIAYELPSGQGDGARLRRYEHADLVEDLFALLDQLGCPQSYLLGSSFGSTIALSAMRARPQGIPRAILAGGFARRRLAPAERMLAHLARWWPGSMKRLPLRRAFSRQVFGHGPPELWEYCVETTGMPAIAAVAQRALALHRIDLRAMLGEIHQPVLLVCGDRDPLVARACEEELLQGLPRAQRVEVQDCGHMIHYSHPQLLAELVRRFLTPPDQAPTCAELPWQASCTNV
jgi:pimeloyl-ACP methyl ester carboxylesterase